MVDLLAKMASSSGMGVFYYSFQQFPKELKGPFHLDKCQLPIIRRRFDLNYFLF